MRISILKAAGAAVCATALTITMGGSSFAAQPMTGDGYKQFTQSSGSISCDGSTRTISGVTGGTETEPQGIRFKIPTSGGIDTWVDLQQHVNGVWQDYSYTHTTGYRGVAVPVGKSFVAPFMYSGNVGYNASITAPSPGTWRLIFLTQLSNKNSLDLISGHNMMNLGNGVRGTLVSYGGHQCTF